MGMSQAQLASQLGLARTSVTNIESGRQPIQIQMLYRIAASLGVGPQDLLPDPSEAPIEDQPQLEAELEGLAPDVQAWARRLVALGDGSGGSERR